jgi:glycerol uptake facilitator protein
MSADLPRRLLAEAIGTGILVMFGAGSVVAALTLGGGELDYAGLGMVAISFGLAVALAIYAFGNTSGAHINPAVTVSLAAVGRFPWADTPAYIGAQLVGAVAGATLIVSAFGGDAVDLGMGQTSIADGTNYIQAIVAEAIATFLLVTAIMALAVDKRAPGGWAGHDRSLRDGRHPGDRPAHGRVAQPGTHLRAAGDRHDRGGDTFWGDLPASIIGPVLGGAAAAFAFDAVARPRLFELELAQGTQGVVEGRRDQPVEPPAVTTPGPGGERPTQSR